MPQLGPSERQVRRGAASGASDLSPPHLLRGSSVCPAAGALWGSGMRWQQLSASLGLRSPPAWDLGEGTGAFAASEMGRHSWTGRQRGGEVPGGFLTCWEERELAGRVWVLRSPVTHTPGLSSESQAWWGLRVPGTCRWLPCRACCPSGSSAGARFGNRCQRVQTLLRALCTWPHLRRRMARALAPRLLLDQAPTGHTPCAFTQAGRWWWGKSLFPGVIVGWYLPASRTSLQPIYFSQFGAQPCHLVLSVRRDNLLRVEGGLAENGECFHFPGSHSSPRERKA